MSEAEQAIEWLRTDPIAVAHRWDQCRALCEEWDRLEAENARLRTALQTIFAGEVACDVEYDPELEHLAWHYYTAHEIAIRNCARKALAGEEGK